MKKGALFRKRNGFALIAVMWVVAFLSMILSVTILLVGVESEAVAAEEHEFRAWQLAHMGLSYASHPGVDRGNEVLSFQPEDVDEAYQVIVQAEASRINLNHVIRVGDKALLRKLFQYWLNDDVQADELTDAMIDWVDADDLVSLNGAEKEWYNERGFENRPFNREFRSLDEVRLVKGFNRIEDNIPDWKNWFTLHSVGAVDIHEAEAELLSVVGETSLANAEQFALIVKGEDEVLGTSDDFRFLSVASALDSLASEIVNTDIISQRFILQGSTLRVESVGRSGVYRKKIQAVIRMRGEVPRVLSYQETVLESE